MLFGGRPQKKAKGTAISIQCLKGIARIKLTPSEIDQLYLA